MDKDTKQMLKKVAIYDLLIVVLATVISVIRFKEYAVILIIAIILSLANFALNAVVTNYMLQVSGRHIYYIFAAIGRIVITVAIVVILCEKDMNNYIAFLIGYSLHYIAVTFYGVTQATLKKKGSN